MDNLFVLYDLSKELKRKGFDEPCMMFYVIPILNGTPELRDNYSKHGLWFKHNSDEETKTWNDPDCKCSAPSYQQVIDWFREKHNIFIYVKDDPEGYCGCVVTKSSGVGYESSNYYGALIIAIKESLKLI